MKMTVRPKLILALALLSILAVYFQSIYHPFSLFDDLAIVERYGVNSTLSFLDVITPGAGFYFRPLVELSYWADYQLWGMDSTFMHLENIVVHLLNVFLVFLIASRLTITSGIKSLPILSALLFGLHPINSESVNWIAGRTDVYAGLFVFIAVYCLIRAVQEQSTRFAILAFGVAFVGMLAKETAIMFFPAAFLVTTYWPVMPQDVAMYRVWRRRFLFIPNIISIILFLSLLLFVYSKGQGNNAISLVFEGNNHVFIRSFEALGFYVKKLFLPLPLNMAIVKVSPLYIIAGIITPCLFIVTRRRAGYSWIFLASSVLFILPAIIVAVAPFAWTPFGERYLYIPSAFAVIGCVEGCHRFFVQQNIVKWFMPLVIIVIAISSIATFQRGILWGDNLALLEDTITKSPHFGVIRNQYGILLMLAGRRDEAEKQFKIALQQNNKESIKRLIKINLIWMKIDGKPLHEARRILLAEFASKTVADTELLVQMSRIEESLLGKAKSLKERKELVAEIIETFENLFLKTGEPFYLYRAGQVALSIDDKQKAAFYFRKVSNDVRLKEYYRQPARRLAEKLEAK
jgi:tetratricopeptide (TPR) repeat protein